MDFNSPCEATLTSHSHPFLPSLLQRRTISIKPATHDACFSARLLAELELCSEILTGVPLICGNTLVVRKCRERHTECH